jgi:hypothetical protein
MASGVVPGLSFVQKWRIRSPAVIPDGILRTLLVPSNPIVVFCEERVGYAGPDGEGVPLGVNEGV